MEDPEQAPLPSRALLESGIGLPVGMYATI